MIVGGGPGRRPRVLTVRTANGLLSFSNMDSVVAKGLYIGRAWEFGFLTDTMAYLRREGYLGEGPGDCMIDVGANIGMICIAMLEHGYFSNALAFEPSAETFAFLERNVHQNGMAASVRAHRCGVSDVAGEMLLEFDEHNAGDQRLRVGAETGSFGEEGWRTAPVPVRTLDDVLAEPGAPAAERIGLIWVDIQGHEGRFLSGARRTLAAGVPVVSEFWPYGILRAGSSREEFTDIVTSLFPEIVHVDTRSNRFERHQSRVISELFDAYPDPETFGEVIFLPAKPRYRSNGAGMLFA